MIGLQPISDADDTSTDDSREKLVALLDLAERLNAEALVKLAEESAHVARTQAEVDGLRRELYRLDQEIAHLRSSASWRFTAPLRSMRYWLGTFGLQNLLILQQSKNLCRTILSILRRR